MRLSMCRHVPECLSTRLWDREQYGFPAVNQQLVMMKMLDNCGSFGSAMLEAYSEYQEPTFLPIAERIAEFHAVPVGTAGGWCILSQCVGEYAENTMWADDLYMSTPFLVRYARVTGNSQHWTKPPDNFRCIGSICLCLSSRSCPMCMILNTDRQRRFHGDGEMAGHCSP